MIKFDVKNGFTGEVQFTAEIDCKEDAPQPIKLGLAVQWAIKTYSNLVGASLAGANLAGANLDGAKWRNGIVINNPPIQIYGLQWPVTIIDEHMEIGCELHRLSEWESFDDATIGRMDVRNARTFWAAHKDALLGMARGAGRSFEPLKASEAKE